MAIICAICQKKQSGWLQDFPLSEDHKDLRICNKCFDQLQIIQNGLQTDISAPRAYFEEIFRSECTAEDVQATINAMIYRIEHAEEEEAEAKKRAEEAKLEAERLEKERQNQLEHDRIIYEENLRQSRKEKYDIRLKKLKEQGAAGYYEYKVISLLDSAGLFHRDSGKANVTAMTEILNDLGADGWHLVTAYSNELGKNALSGGVLGINSTVDENILIFERFIKF